MDTYNQVLNLFETSSDVDIISQDHVVDVTKPRPSDWDSDEEDGPWPLQLVENPFCSNNINLLISAAVQEVVLHPVQLKIVSKPKYNPDNPVVFDSYDLTEQDELWCKNHSYLKSVIFPHITKIVAISDKEGNKDSRGGGCGCCEFNITEFIWEETFTNGVKLFDLASVIYRLKGSKYDWWYELYDHSKFIIIENTLFINVNFAYGS